MFLCREVFLFWLTSIFSLSFSDIWILYAYVCVSVCLMFILLGVLWASWICNCMSVTNFTNGKILCHYFKKYFFCSIFALFSMSICYTAWNCPTLFIRCFILFYSLFAFCFSVWLIFTHLSSNSQILSLAVSSLLSLLEVFKAVTDYFTSSSFIWFFLIVSISLLNYLFHISCHLLCSIKVSNILIKIS